MKKIILSIMFLLISNWIIACSCSMRTLENALMFNDRIFLGKVIEEKDITIPVIIEETNDTMRFHYLKSVTFQILKNYKGNSKNEFIEIITGRGKGDCGYYFIKGEQYVVYANKGYYINIKTDNYTTDICERTTNKYKEEVATLEKYSEWERNKLYRNGRKKRREYKRLRRQKARNNTDKD